MNSVLKPSLYPNKTARVKQSFYRALTTYNKHAVVQQTITERLISYLQQHSGLAFNNMLEIGCGTGFLTQKIAVNCTWQKFYINDLMPECKPSIAATLQAAENWQFLAGDIESISIPKPLDLVISASALQWINDTAAFLERLKLSMVDGGYLVFSTFGPKHFNELNQLQGSQSKSYCLAYHALEQWQDFLNEDFSIKLLCEDTHKMSFANARELLLHLRYTGVNGNCDNRWTKTKLKQFLADYEKQFSIENQVHLSYNPVYVIAQKKQQPSSTG